MSEEKTILTSCIHDCGGRCLLKAHVKDGVLTRIENRADEEEYLRGCLRGRAFRQALYDPNRLKYPMKRVGERGEGKFERITWDEALDTIARELKRVKEKYGNASILYLFGGGGGNGSIHGRRSVHRLLNMFGGCTTDYGNVSNEAAIFSGMVSYGTMDTGNSRKDHINSKLLILWGWNPVDTIWDSGTAWHLTRAKEAGARCVCVDPRYSDTAAAFADQWIPIKPSTDAAMVIAMAYVIIKENLLDQKFLDTYTVGFPEYKRYVMGEEDGKPKTPEWAAAITGVPAKTIENLAREYATTKPAALLGGWAAGRTSNGEQYHRAAVALAAMTGNVGIHGGNASGGWEGGYPSLWIPMRLPSGDNPVLKGANLRKGDVPVRRSTSARIHRCKIWDAVLRGKSGGYPADFKLLWVLGRNQIDQGADANNGDRALKSKSLEFVIVNERVMSATARYADILLPACTFLEREDMAPPWLGEGYYVYAQKAVEPIYDSKTDLEMSQLLAPRLGINNFSDKSEEEWALWAAENCRDVPDAAKFQKEGYYKIPFKEPYISFKEQIEDPKNHPFKTPSGKIEIYSKFIADLKNPQIPPVPKYIEPKEGPGDPLIKKYPLQFINTHFRPRIHSQLGQIPWLKDAEPHALWINPIDAEPRGIKNGNKVKVFNDRGVSMTTARVTERIMPGVVHLPEGGNYNPDKNGVDQGGCANVFTREEPSPAGAYPSNSVLVQVQKA